MKRAWFVLMARQTTTGSLAARLVLTMQLVVQIFLTPLVAFGLTYLLVFNIGGGQMSVKMDVNMIPWIGIASLFYGMLALILALGMGGFMPNRVIEHGGWRQALGLARNARNSTRRYAKRKKYESSSHGKLSLLVYERHEEGHKLWTIRGSLVLLAIPFQVLLATIPLALVLLFPKDIIHQNRQLELALLLYTLCLFVSIRMFPYVARKYISYASLARRFLRSTMKIAWIFPVFLLWSMGQISNWLVQRWMGSDMTLNIQFEKEVFESLISAGPIPETSFLNLLTALAVMPMAAFTTLAVLGGGSGAPPAWMRTPSDSEGGLEQEEQISSSLVNRLAARNEAPNQVHTQAVVQQIVVPVAMPLHDTVSEAEPANLIQEPSTSLDGIDLDLFDFDEPPNENESISEQSPSHNDPIIRGFDVREQSK